MDANGFHHILAANMMELKKEVKLEEAQVSSQPIDERD